MKISSEHINNLLAYARERHGAPCRVELAAVEFAWGGEVCSQLDCAFYWAWQSAEFEPWEPRERILI